MIGNDVVDLLVAKRESNWRRAGYLKKIFSKSEQNLIEESENPDHLVWMLWSMKESAYKIFNRRTGNRVFNPTYFDCRAVLNLNGMGAGRVQSLEGTYYTSTTIIGEQLHTVATRCSKDLDLAAEVPEDVNFNKVGNLPFLHFDGDVMPISISHHGRFCRKVYLRPSLDFSFKNSSAIS